MSINVTPISKQVEDIATQVVDSAYSVRRSLGPGLLESAYECCLEHELTKRGLQVQSQVGLPVFYDNIYLNVGHRIDLLVNNYIIIEVKAVDEIIPIHISQLLTYLRFSGHRLGFVINFNSRSFKDGVKRVVR